MRRLLLVSVRVGCFFLVAITIWVASNHFSSETWSLRKVDSETESNDASVPEQTESSFDTAPYIQAIFDREDKTFPRLECPLPDVERYGYLANASQELAHHQLHYFFALDLRQSVAILPRLLGSIIEAIQLLGPSSCALSIVEGHSDDGTRAILSALRTELARLGLRNLALAPLVSPTSFPAISTAPPPGPNTTVVFMNDVAACVSDILELIHQRITQSAQMTCAMDWTYVGAEPTFYDVWVARTLRGDLFFDIPPDGNWNSAWNLFWNDTQTKSKFRSMAPFQVYACWNGAVVFGAEPVITGEKGKGRIEFRGPREGECFAGEPTLFAKDLWFAGYGRIAVVPTVNLEYSDEAAVKIKAAKGYTSRWTSQEDASAMMIGWVDQPPDTTVEAALAS
ncbi:alpha-1,3-mannosyltransferase CMT1 [Xylariomycetidae sp. FL2044]|nr:alpha-1,3-mannosyltransferase CMT1 [Xylariomycetidae sp. FL2044]